MEIAKISISIICLLSCIFQWIYAIDKSWVRCRGQPKLKPKMLPKMLKVKCISYEIFWQSFRHNSFVYCYWNKNMNMKRIDWTIFHFHLIELNRQTFVLPIITVITTVFSGHIEAKWNISVNGCWSIFQYKYEIVFLGSHTDLVTPIKKKE